MVVPSAYVTEPVLGSARAVVTLVGFMIFLLPKLTSFRCSFFEKLKLKLRPARQAVNRITDSVRCFSNKQHLDSGKRTDGTGGRR